MEMAEGGHFVWSLNKNQFINHDYDQDFYGALCIISQKVGCAVLKFCGETTDRVWIGRAIYSKYEEKKNLK